MRRGRPKGSKNRPKQKKPVSFDPRSFGGEGEELAEEAAEAGAFGVGEQAAEGGDPELPSPEAAALIEGTSLAIYTRVPEYERRALEFLEDEEKLEKYIQRSALVLMQMERDQSVLMPTTRTEVAAAIRSRQNFVQRAMELLQLLLKNKEKRIQELEARAEVLAREEGRGVGVDDGSEA